MGKRIVWSYVLILLLAAAFPCAASGSQSTAAGVTVALAAPATSSPQDSDASFLVQSQAQVPSQIPALPQSPKPIPVPWPTPVPYQYKGSELSSIQRALAFAGYYGSSSADEAATNQLDAPTKAAIKGYLSVLRRNPRTARDYLTQAEYKALAAMGSMLPTPTPAPGSIVMTPRPTAIMLLPETTGAANEAPAASLPAFISSMNTVQAVYEWAQIPPTHTPEPPATPVPTAAPTPEPAAVPSPTPVPLQVSEPWFGRRRSDELHIRVVVSMPNQETALLDASGKQLATVQADGAGKVAFHLKQAEHGDAVHSRSFTLQVSRPVVQRVPLNVEHIRQDTLLGFTDTLDNNTLLIVGGALILLAFALLAAARFAGKRAAGNTKNGTKGRMSP